MYYVSLFIYFVLLTNLKLLCLYQHDNRQKNLNTFKNVFNIMMIIYIYKLFSYRDLLLIIVQEMVIQ